MYNNLTEIKTIVDNILGEEMNNEVFYQIINIVKDRVEDSKEWLFLRTSTPITSSTMTLPTDFGSIRKVKLGYVEFLPIKFEDKDTYPNVSNIFYIDYASNQIVIPGAYNGTPTLYYNKTTPTLTSSVNPVWPSRFWPRLAFDAVGYFQNGMDADDVYARMSIENKTQALELKRAMIYWDTKNQIKAQGGRSGMENGHNGGASLETM